MTAESAEGPPDIDTHDVIHLGGEVAVVVPAAEYRRLRALERSASPQDLEDADDAAALQDWKAREAAGQTSYVAANEVRQRLGLLR